MHHSRKMLPATVYLAVNKINGKRYIGVTTHSLGLRARQHFSAAKNRKFMGAFYKAIRKYGDEVFEFSVLTVCATGREGLREEMRLIAEMKPEYNSTAGGDGNVGREMSAAGRSRLSKFHTGKQWHLGRRHSDAAKHAVRNAQFKPEIVAAWSERSRLGPQAQARPVVCLDDSKTYPSLRVAARQYDVDLGTLVKVCSGKRYRKTVGGYRFAYAEAV